MKQLEDRVAFVTGGASGIGRGMAGRFAAAGMKVVIADIEQAPRERAVAELKASGADVVGVDCDVARPDSMAKAAQSALDAFGAVHVVCNNAGVAGGTGAGRPSWEQPLADWEWVVGVNLWGVIHGVRALLPILLEQEEGHIVNTASLAGLAQGSGVYGITKHGVVAYSESLYSELQARQAKVGVSVLCPGWVNTRILESERNRPEVPRDPEQPAAPQAEAMRAMVTDMIKRGLDPAVVGDMVVDAIRSNRLYVHTHPEMTIPAVRTRMQNILESRNPEPRAFGQFARRDE